MDCVAPIEQVAKQQRVERGGNRGKKRHAQSGSFRSVERKRKRPASICLNRLLSNRQAQPDFDRGRALIVSSMRWRLPTRSSRYVKQHNHRLRLNTIVERRDDVTVNCFAWKTGVPGGIVEALAAFGLWALRVHQYRTADARRDGEEDERPA